LSSRTVSSLLAPGEGGVFTKQTQAGSVDGRTKLKVEVDT